MSTAPAPLPPLGSSAVPGQTCVPGQPGSPGSAGGAPDPDARQRSPWLPSLRGVALMTGLELRQRVRSVRWYVGLGVWAVILLGLSLLMLSASAWTTGAISLGTESTRMMGALALSVLIMLVVFAMLMILPAVSAGSVNGDRTAGTLAILQVSLLSPADIAIGKLLAGWVTGLAFLAAAMPSILPAAFAAGISPFYLLRVVLMLAFLALCITALGLGLSSFASRQLGSVVLAYLVALGITFVLPMAWTTSLPLLFQDRTMTVWNEVPATSGTGTAGDDVDDMGWDYADDTEWVCAQSVEETQVVRTDLALPLLWPNPFVMVADMAPTASDEPEDWQPDLLQLISTGMRYAADPMHPSLHNNCWDQQEEGYPTDLGTPADRPVWPLGAAVWLLIAAGSMAFTIQRLRTPVRKLPSGTRIA